MEKYYVSEVMTFTDGTKDSVGIYARDNQTEAEALMHKDLGAWMIKPNIKAIAVVIFTENGIVMNYFWNNPTPNYPTDEAEA